MRIFDALLRLAELDAGMRRSGFVPLDLVDLAATAVEFYAPAAELKNIGLALDSTGPVPASGDPVLLAQALSNLIDNALKYAPQNGEILVSVRRHSDGAAEIAVTDSGPGIAADERAKVVGRFYRGDASRGTPGVGLGLSLVQAVAKLHGSTLELQSREGGITPGLRVVMVLPAGTAAAPPRGDSPDDGGAPRIAPDAAQGAGAAV
jgi:signal transduction histidine kinase